MSDFQNFIEEYMRVTERLESPTSYLEWGARLVIAATMRDLMKDENIKG